MTLRTTAILTLLVSWWSLDAEAQGGAMPDAFRLLAPPLRPWATLWVEAEDAASNIGIEAKADTYGGKHRVLYTQQAPGAAGYFVGFPILVPPDRGGRFRLFAACGPVGKAYVSNTAVIVDGQPLRRLAWAPAGERSWGVSNAVRWVDLGEVSLAAGPHRLELVVREPRAMDSSYAQEFDAMALVHESDMLFPATFAVADSAGQWSLKAGEGLRLSIGLQVLTATLPGVADAVAVMRLSGNGGTVVEAPVPLRVGPESVGRKVGLETELPVPFDTPSGAYALSIGGLCGQDGQLAVLPAGSVQVRGLFPALPPSSPRLGVPRVVAATAAKASTRWTFRVAVECAAEVPDPPRRLVVRLEFGPHLCYLAESFTLPTAPWPAGNTAELGPFELPLPADLPAGEYAVQVALVGEAYANQEARHLTAGTLTVEGSVTPQTTSLKPLAYGTFVDNRGVPHAWHSTPSHALVWDGEPFLPVSGMLNGPYLSWAKGPAEFERLQANIQAIRKHGLDHVYLYTQGSMEGLPPHAWEFLMDYLEGQGMSYVIGYPGGSPGIDTAITARPVRARPDIALGVDGIALPGKASRRLTGPELGCAPRAVVSCLALAIDAEGNACGVVDATVGEASDKGVDVAAYFPAAPAGSYQVLFLPRVRAGFCTGNPWGKGLEQIAKALDYLSRLRFRPGFRGFIDLLLPNERGIYNQAESLFIEEPVFLADRAEWLAQRHGTVARLAVAWALLDPPPASFAVAARLFPAHSGTVLVLVDPLEHRAYRATAGRSQAWVEYIEQRDDSYGRFQNRICDAIREQVDVPIIVKRCGVTERYHSNPNRSDRGVDGAGYEIYAAGDNLSPYGAGPGYAEMLQAGKCMIGAATEFNRAFAEDGPANWPDIASFFYDLAVAQYLGAKGTYLFLFDVLPHNYLTRNRLIEDGRMLEWMGLWKRLLDARREAVAAHTPLVYTSWPPGDSWWARPSERRAVRETDDAPGTITAKAPNGVWVLPVWDPEAAAPLTVVTLADDPAVRCYAAAFERLLERGDRTVVFLGHCRNLGALSIDRYFTPETFELDDDVCQVLQPGPDATVLEKDSQGRVWALQQGTLQIVARRPRKPGALDGALRWIHCPPVPDDARSSARGFLEKLMGVKPLALAGGRFRGISFVAAGQPVTFLHSTDRAGSEILELHVPEGKTVTATVPAAEGRVTEGRGGTTLSLSFPPGPGSEGRKGPGAGGVTLIGLRPEELHFSFAGTPVAALASSAGSVGSAVPQGCALPPLVLPEITTPAHIDEAKAVAALGQAVEACRGGNPAEAERFGREWIGLATPRLLPAFCLLLGHARLQQGDAKEARAFYERGLAVAPQDAGLRVALGTVLLALGDRAAARREWTRAATTDGPAGATARANLAP